MNVNDAISAHLVWKQKLAQLLTGEKIDLDPDYISSDCRCTLGKWIKQSMDRHKENNTFQKLKLVHTDFHLCAGDIARRALAGKVMSREMALGSNSEFDVKSREIIELLEKIRAEKNK